MNKQTIITILLFLVTVAGISNAFDFRIDDEDVTIAVNKDVAGNDIPNKETAEKRPSPSAFSKPRAAM